MVSLRDFQPTARFPEAAALALSPDGLQVAYVDDTPGQFNLSVRSIEGGPARQLTDFTDRPVRQVHWSPDGNTLVFVADADGNEAWQLYQIQASGGVPHALTDAPRVRHWLAQEDPFSPDGRYLAYAANDRDPGMMDVLVRDLLTGQTRRVLEGHGQTFPVQWSPQGDRISAITYRGGHSDHLVDLIPIDGGDAVRLTDDAHQAVYEIGTWTPDASSLLLVTDLGREYTGLGQISTTTGEISWLDKPDWNVEEAALAADGRTLTWTVNVGGMSHLRARDLADDTPIAVPDLPMGHADGLCLSRDGRRLVLRLSTPTRPRNLAVVDLPTGELRWLTDAKPIAADPARFVEPTLVRYPTPDRVDIPAYLYRPPTPAGWVISIHGGPNMQEQPTYRYNGLYQYLASRGVGVLAPNIRGSAGYGASYQGSIHRNWGTTELVDIAAAVHYLRSLDGANADRIGLYGFSYGAFVVLSLISRRPDLNWAAAVDICGPTNLITLANAAPAIMRSVVTQQIGDPDADRDSLAARSPLTYADQIDTPLLVVGGAEDTRVPRSESDQLVEQLHAHGIEVDYDLIPGEGHGFTQRANELRARSTAAEFLIRHLTRRWSGT